MVDALGVPRLATNTTANAARRQAPVANARTNTRNDGPTDVDVWKTEIADVEGLTGQKVAFKDDKELNAYLLSLQGALPQSAYDPDGFLKDTLGLTDLRASGRQDKATVAAVRAKKGYRPTTTIDGHHIFIQQWLFTMAHAHPHAFLRLTRLTNPIIEAPARQKKDYKGNFQPVQPVKPSNVTPQDRYPNVYAPMVTDGFGPDFHAGIPNSGDPADARYGTYALALGIGFSDEQAKRIAVAANGIDRDTTPYGATRPTLAGALDRHFNLNRNGEDTRLIWAQRHLQSAIAYANKGSYDEAEIELGCGLHSLQDLFAHGQLSPSVHATLGEFPDEVFYNPVAVAEASAATHAYMETYLRGITPVKASARSNNQAAKR